MIVTVTSGNKTFRFHDPVDDYDVLSNLEADPKLNNQQNCVKYTSQKSSVQFSNHNRTSGRRRPSRRDLQRKSSVARFITKTAKTVRPEKGVHTLDKYSRVVFPISYTLFLIIYFSVQYQLGSRWRFQRNCNRPLWMSLNNGSERANMWKHTVILADRVQLYLNLVGIAWYSIHRGVSTIVWVEDWRDGRRNRSVMYLSCGQASSVKRKKVHYKWLLHQI